MTTPTTYVDPTPDAGVSSGFNLHALALEIVREHPSADPGTVADELVTQIPVEYYEDALRYMGRTLVRTVWASQRSRVGGAAAGGGSRKIDAAREAWKRLLDLPEYLPSTATWVHLRDASREQVLEMAHHRLRKAHENAVASERYRAIADEMESANVARVADLSEDFLQTALAGQDAVA